MTPTKADFVEVLEAVEDGQPLSRHERWILVAALRHAIHMAGQEATPGKPEISLLPAVLTKMEESCDLLREVRDMMRRKNPQHIMRAHDFGMGWAELGRSLPSKCPDPQRAGSASPIPKESIDPREGTPE